MKKRHFAVVILMLGAVTLTLEWQKGVFGVSVLSTTARTADETNHESSSETTSRPASARLIDQIAVRLLEQYGERIEDPAVQVSLLAEKRKALVEKQKTVRGKLDETLYQLGSIMESNYEAQGLDALGQPAVRKTMESAFFGLDAVQEKLAAMPADARQSEINRLRERLRYSDEAIKKLEKRDRERKALSQRYSGKRLEKELSELRQTHFGSEAPTIAREEENGFFRYNRERVFGRN